MMTRSSAKRAHYQDSTFEFFASACQKGDRNSLLKLQDRLGSPTALFSEESMTPEFFFERLVVVWDNYCHHYDPDVYLNNKEWIDFWMAFAAQPCVKGYLEDAEITSRYFWPRFVVSTDLKARDTSHLEENYTAIYYALNAFLETCLLSLGYFHNIDPDAFHVFANVPQCEIFELLFDSGSGLTVELMGLNTCHFYPAVKARGHNQTFTALINDGMKMTQAPWLWEHNYHQIIELIHFEELKAYVQWFELEENEVKMTALLRGLFLDTNILGSLSNDNHFEYWERLDDHGIDVFNHPVYTSISSDVSKGTLLECILKGVSHRGSGPDDFAHNFVKLVETWNKESKPRVPGRVLSQEFMRMMFEECDRIFPIIKRPGSFELLFRYDAKILCLLFDTNDKQKAFEKFFECVDDNAMFDFENKVAEYAKSVGYVVKNL